MKNSKTIAVVGAGGKMGTAICNKLKDMFEIVKVEMENSLEDYLNKRIDLVIDFSTARQSVVSANFCAKNNIPLIIGTTGQSEYEMNQIKSASKKTKIIISSNFSLGIFIIKQLISKLKYLLKNQVCDITIIEKHHKNKLDSPSGTALMIKNEIQNALKDEKFSLNILSERGGKEIGTHQIDIYFGDELISLSHKAFSRDAFVDGVFLTVCSIFN